MADEENDNMTLEGGRRDTMLCRRMARILSRRVKRMDGVTLYKGGYVELSKVMASAPFFKRFNMTEEEVLAKLAADSQFTVQGKYVKVNSGLAFDPNAVELPDVPSA